ncbi:MAG: butyrate kinase, partial [Bacteroidales bacterium]|nr:butyrate kinase [Bacteroidales bacterium]
DQVKKMIKGEGGFVAYLGTNDAYEIEMRIKDGDEKAKEVHDALAYQLGKDIGALSAVLKGKVDAIILTGGMAHDKMLVDYVKEMVQFIAPVTVYPGEDEMEALAMNGLMVMKGEIEPKVYQ